MGSKLRLATRFAYSVAGPAAPDAYFSDGTPRLPALRSGRPFTWPPSQVKVEFARGGRSVMLPAGQQILTVCQDNGGWNIHGLTFG
jgi:hypothetical protein